MKWASTFLHQRPYDVFFIVSRYGQEELAVSWQIMRGWAGRRRKRGFVMEIPTMTTL